MISHKVTEERIQIINGLGIFCLNFSFQSFFSFVGWCMCVGSGDCEGEGGLGMCRLKE